MTYAAPAGTPRQPSCICAPLAYQNQTPSSFIAPKELYDYYYERVEVPDVPEGYRDNLHPVMKRWLQRRRLTDVTDGETRKARAAYYGLLEYSDNTMGQLLGSLDQVGLADDTVVIYTSDQGDSAGRSVSHACSLAYSARKKARKSC